MSRIANIIKSAHVLFQNPRAASEISLQLNDKASPLFGKFESLRSSVSDLTAEDVNFDTDLVKDRALYTTVPYSPALPVPATYIDIFDGSKFTVGIFVLRNGFALPMHNHPDMYGMVKVLFGRAKIESFNPLSEEAALRALDHCVVRDELGDIGKVGNASLSKEDMVQLLKTRMLCLSDECSVSHVGPESPAAVLTPTVHNVHRITAVDGPLAFLDILAPPYDHSTNTRVCSYFEEVDLNILGLVHHQCLRRVNAPNWYWTNTATYQGPPLD